MAGQIQMEMTEEQKKRKAEIEAKQAEFRKLLDTPIAEDEATKALAENEVNRCRIRAIIRQCEEQVSGICHEIEQAKTKLVELDGEDAIIRRRLLNEAK